MPRGGARPGAGRKSVGEDTKYITITLEGKVIEKLKEQAAEKHVTVNRHIADLVLLAMGNYRKKAYDNVYKMNISERFVAESAEDEVFYKVEKKTDKTEE